MNINKRTLIATLGLAPLGIGAEAFAAGGPHHNAPMAGFGFDKDWPERREVFAKALENLAAEIRADRVVPMKLNVNTMLEHNEWEKHCLELTFEVVKD